METRKILEGFAVESVEKLIFAVKGLVHPPRSADCIRAIFARLCGKPDS